MPDVYILRCADGSLYTGIAKDAEARLKAHQAGRGGRYTRARRPVELAWRCEVATWREAMQLERAIKRLPRAKKLTLIRSSAIPSSDRQAGQAGAS
ncbi:MAG: GIY-YIG nuclease family protein [Candidatus Roseilinea sp.]|jgi:putative endonuclease|nr:MAG: GIY-YIG nuclease family protein [Candidatus Roseilinea sp.]